jgi:amino-acid N-acetyltransferase
MTVPTLRPAVDSDLPRVIALLEASSLPTVGIAEGLCSLIVAEQDDAIVGVVGLETCCDRYALLRSTAVAESWRGRGLGRQLVQRAISEAEVQGIEALFLLTTTAETYFPSFGFARIAREEVPAEVRASAEFSGACPASATVMSLSLDRP